MAVEFVATWLPFRFFPFFVFLRAFLRSHFHVNTNPVALTAVPPSMSTQTMISQSGLL
ncbi:hypothetical protein [Spirosoma pomorum]